MKADITTLVLTVLALELTILALVLTVMALELTVLALIPTVLALTILVLISVLAHGHTIYDMWDLMCNEGPVFIAPMEGGWPLVSS